MTSPKKNPDGPSAPPTVANGVAYHADGPGAAARPRVSRAAATNGQQLAKIPLTGPLFSAPTVVDGHFYVASWGGFGPG